MRRQNQILCFLLRLSCSSCFLQYCTTNLPHDLLRNQSTKLPISFSGWFGGNKDENHDQQKTDDSIVLSKDGRGTLGGIAGVMDSMERYKKAQRIGKMTASVVQCLSTTTVEGIGAEGMVKAIFDCQQRAVRTTIEIRYFESATASEIASALTDAVKDAYHKSINLMDQITKNFYMELSSDVLELNLPNSDSEKTNTLNTNKNKSTTKVERLRATLNQELASSTVEGSAQNGKVKAVYDCQQRPLSILIDENYFQAAFLVEDVCDAVTTALHDAYARSTEKTDDKMKGLFSEIGLQSS